MTQPIIDAELLLLQLVAERGQPEDEMTRWWRNFQAAAPALVWQYVLDLNDEAQGDPTFSRAEPDPWMARHHPAFESVVEGLHYAFRAQLDMDARLRHVQGWVLKMAEWRLGYALAHERAAGKTATVYDAVVRNEAAMLLLGWSGAESNAAWLEPERFVDQWRVAGTDNAETLERAGLHAAEVELLAAS